jgi:hypothetical protein
MENNSSKKINNSNSILSLKINLEKNNPPEYRTPLYYESWNWEGDKSVLPYKWSELVNDSKITIPGINQYSNTDEYLKMNYYKNPEFDEKSFFFVTHRSQTAGCAYLDKNNIIKFLIVGKNHKNKQVEHSLITRAIKRAIEINNKKTEFEIKVDLTLTNFEKDLFEIWL